MPARGEERAAGHEGHIFLQALDQQVTGAEVFRQGDPHEQAAAWPCIGDALGEERVHRLQGNIPPALVGSPDDPDMRVDVVEFHIFFDFHLRQGVALQIGPLLDQHELAYQGGIAGDPADAVAGAEDLGEGAGDEHIAVLVKVLDAGQEIALKAQLAIGIVLNHGDAVTGAHFGQAAAALKAPGAAGGVLKVGDHVNQPGAGTGGEQFIEPVNDHALVIRGNLQKFTAVGAEGADSGQVGRAFAQHHIALIQENLAGQVQRLLGAVGDQHLIGGQVRTQADVHAAGDTPAQGSEALRGGVLQRAGCVVFQHQAAGLDDLAHGEQLGRRQAARERNDLGLFRQFQDLPDLGCLQVVHSPGRFQFHARHLPLHTELCKL